MTVAPVDSTTQLASLQARAAVSASYVRALRSHVVAAGQQDEIVLEYLARLESHISQLEQCAGTLALAYDTAVVESTDDELLYESVSSRAWAWTADNGEPH